MIIRQLALRQGRVALSKPAVRSWRRALATAVDQHKATGTDTAEVLTARPNTQKKLSREEQLAAFATSYRDSKAFREWSSTIGSSVTPHYRPHELVNNPPGPSDITLELLMASQAHLGHATGLWHPGNARYIYGIREGIHIISLDVTASHLRRACMIVEATTRRGGLVLFVGTRKGQERSVVKAAELSRGCHLFDRWVPGTITNRNQILGRCQLRVVNEQDQILTGFDNQLLEQAALKPDLVVCLNPLENFVLLRECRQHHIPTIGVVDTDCNPTWVTYPIPANDDSRRCTDFIAGVLGRAGERGIDDRYDEETDSFVINHPQGHTLEEPEDVGFLEAELADPEYVAQNEEALDDGPDETEHEDALEPEPGLAQRTEGMNEEELELDVEYNDAMHEEFYEQLSEQEKTSFEAAANVALLSDNSALGTYAFDQLHRTEALTGEQLRSGDERAEATEQAEKDELADAKASALAGKLDKQNNNLLAESSQASGSENASGKGPPLEERTAEDEGEQLVDPRFDWRQLEPRSDDLTLLIAQKRRALGETLSARDRAALAPLDKLAEEVRAGVELQRAEWTRQAAQQRTEAELEHAEDVEAEALEGVEEAEVEGRERIREGRRSRTAHYDEPVQYGPVLKHRKGSGRTSGKK